MADIDVNIYQAVTNRDGVSTPVSGVISGDPLPNPLNPTTGNEYTAGDGLTLTNREFSLGDNVNHIFALEETYKQFASFLQWAVNNHISLISGYSDVDRAETSIGAYNFTPMGSNNKQAVINLQRYIGSHSSVSLKTINVNTTEEIGFFIRENESGASVFEAVDDVELKGITYKADYSANYTNRSLVDKEYVDGLAGGIGITLNGQVIGGVKRLIEIGDTLVIPLYYEYNVFYLDIDGTIENNGEINFI